MSEFARWAAQLQTLRTQVNQAYLDAEKELEEMETRDGVSPQDLETKTEALERLESVLECLDEALAHCED